MDGGFQGVINSLEDGIGRRLVRGFLFLVVVGLLFGAYIHSQFRGLRDADAMEYAQLARELSSGKGFTTRCLRPFDLGQIERWDRRAAPRAAWPDIRHAPAYPFLVSWGFRVIDPSSRKVSTGSVFSPEARVILPLNISLCLLTGFFVYRLGRHFFNERIAWIAVLTYWVSESVLRDAISGLPIPLMSLLLTAGSYASVRAASVKSEGGRIWVWLPLFLLAAVLSAAAFLTKYSLVVVIPMLALFLGIGMGQGRGAWIGLFVLVTVLVVCPWLVRNARTSGQFLGVAPYAVLEDSILYPGDSLARESAPALDNVGIYRSVTAKLRENLPRFVDRDLRTIGNGLLVCLFLVSFLFKFERDDANLFRWWLAVGMLLMAPMTAVGGRDSARDLNVFLPFVALFGVAGISLILERTDWIEPVWVPIVMGAVVSLSALATLMTVLGSRAGWPYPPYYPPFVSLVCNTLGPEEAICTDIPWATAWYGNHTSLLLPRSPDRLTDLNERLSIKGVYLTTETGNKPYVGSLVSGEDRFWLPLINRRVPRDFPFKHGIALPPGSHDQLFLTDQVRWTERRE